MASGAPSGSVAYVASAHAVSISKGATLSNVSCSASAASAAKIHSRRGPASPGASSIQRAMQAGAAALAPSGSRPARRHQA
jgi:hypothetical protein